MARRTQAERRDATIERLVDATVDALAEVGYARTTVSEICRRAELSQGALFRQFDTRQALIARATEAIGERHLAAFADVFGAAPLDLARLVSLIRELCRTPTHAAWHEVMVAARTDDGLRAAVGAVLAAFEAAVLDAVRATLPVPPEHALRVGTFVLSIMHLFDSEAVTVPVKASPAIERARIDWAVDAFKRELGAFGFA